MFDINTDRLLDELLAELTNNETSVTMDIEDLSVDNLLYILYRLSYIDKEFTLNSLSRALYKGYSKRGDNVREAIGYLLNPDDDNKPFIELLSTSINCKGLKDTYFKLTQYAIDEFKYCYIDNKITSLYKEMDALVIKDSHRYLSGYELAIAQHNSLNHYVAIDTLIKIANKERIPYKDKHEDTSIRIPNTRMRVEFDIILNYNKREYGVEVELNTTSPPLMDKKIRKHNLLAHKTGKYKRVIMAAPNERLLKLLKRKVEKSIESYERKRCRDNSLPPFQVEYIYLNISTINSRKRLRRYLKDNQRYKTIN